MTLALTKRFFGPLLVLDVGVDPVPLDNVPLLVAQRTRAKEKPPIGPVVPTQPCFGFPWRFRPMMRCHVAARPFKSSGWTAAVQPQPLACSAERPTKSR